MRLARVAEADGRLQICWPRKCVHEVLLVRLRVRIRVRANPIPIPNPNPSPNPNPNPNPDVHEVLRVFSTRFDLHQELYQHRVGAAVGYMLRDALRHASARSRVRVRLRVRVRVGVSET